MHGCSDTGAAPDQRRHTLAAKSKASRLEASTTRMEVDADVCAAPAQATGGRVINRNTGNVHCERSRVLPPEYYSRKVEELANNGIYVGFDGSIIEGDEENDNLVYCLECEKVFKLVICIGSHILEFDNGMKTIAPIFQAYDPREDDDEYVFAHNCILLRSLAAKTAGKPRPCLRMGRTAKALTRWCAMTRAMRD